MRTRFDSTDKIAAVAHRGSSVLGLPPLLSAIMLRDRDMLLLTSIKSVALLASVLSARAYTPKGPRFSWETLPIFFHGSNASGPVNEDGLKVSMHACAVCRNLGMLSPQLIQRYTIYIYILCITVFCIHHCVYIPPTRNLALQQML